MTTLEANIRVEKYFGFERDSVGVFLIIFTFDAVSQTVTGPVDMDNSNLRVLVPAGA